MILLGLLGPRGSGRDRIAKHLVVKHGWAQYRMAGPAREMLELMSLLPEQFEPILRDQVVFGNKTPHWLEDNMMDWGRVQWAPIWRALAAQHIRDRAGNDSPHRPVAGIVISDITADDADWIRENGGSLWHTESIDINAGTPDTNTKHHLDDEPIVLSNPGQDVGPLVDNILPDTLARYVVK